MKRILMMIAMVSLVLPVGVAAEPNQRDVDEAAIRSAVGAYVEAFNSADAKGLAALWSPEAVYLDRQNGVEVVGREAIEKYFKEVFAGSQGIKLEVTTHSIDFISPSVAVESGTGKIIESEKVVEAGDYTAIYVKRDKAWLLDRVTEEEVVQVLSNYEQLKDLEWLVGNWVDQDDTATVVTECHWSRNENFLVRSFAVHIGDVLDLSGMQLIGWDPSTKQIRSWVFDSDGGFGYGTWSKKGNRWSVQQTAVLPDGRKSSAVNILTYVDDNTMTLQSVNRTVDGELLPNIEEVVVIKE